MQTKNYSGSAAKVDYKSEVKNIWLWVILAHAIIGLSILLYFQSKMERIDEKIENIKQH
ncbi:MAG: hypothetical protein KA340_05500 [Saprospiraceae bacterium]|jgi:hypothetical protein|nr:hypothetical protein [Saprospiraceae bacterium]